MKGRVKWTRPVCMQLVMEGRLVSSRRRTKRKTSNGLSPHSMGHKNVHAGMHGSICSLVTSSYGPSEFNAGPIHASVVQHHSSSFALAIFSPSLIRSLSPSLSPEKKTSKVCYPAVPEKTCHPFRLEQTAKRKQTTRTTSFWHPLSQRVGGNSASRGIACPRMNESHTPFFLSRFLSLPKVPCPRLFFYLGRSCWAMATKRSDRKAEYVTKEERKERTRRRSGRGTGESEREEGGLGWREREGGKVDKTTKTRKEEKKKRESEPHATMRPRFFLLNQTIFIPLFFCLSFLSLGHGSMAQMALFFLCYPVAWPHRRNNNGQHPCGCVYYFAGYGIMASLSHRKKFQPKASSLEDERGPGH